MAYDGYRRGYVSFAHFLLYLVPMQRKQSKEVGVTNRGQLFEINDVTSKCFVKISNIDITNPLLLFVIFFKKCENKILKFFQQK